MLEVSTDKEGTIHVRQVKSSSSGDLSSSVSTSSSFGEDKGDNHIRSSYTSIHLINIYFLAAQALQKLANVGKSKATTGQGNPLISLKPKTKTKK